MLDFIYHVCPASSNELAFHNAVRTEDASVKMGDSLTLYRSPIEFVWQAGVRLHDFRCLYALAWAVVGLLLSHSINLSHGQRYGLARREPPVKNAN